VTFRVLHFASDEKFIPLTQDLFEAALPGQSEFRVHAEGGRLRYVRAGPGVRQVGRDYFGSPAAAEDLRGCDCLVIHGLIPHFAPALRQLPDTVLVLWAGWGFDYYDLLEPHVGPLVLPDTARLQRNSTVPDRIRHFARPAARIWRRLVRALHPPPLHPAQEFASRFDLISVPGGEVELVRQALPRLRAESHRIIYATTEDTLAVGPDVAGPDVLVGNSATPTNNHAEAFAALARLDLAGRRIVVPLNYGSPAYAEAVCRLGRRQFGEAFVPLRRFMPLAEYHDVTKTCGTVIMNHRRQQAVGTLSTALYKGARVFLRPENPVYGFYSKMGITLASTDDLARGDKVFAPLAPALRAQNRERVGAHFSRATALDAIRRLRDRRRVVAG
jgi:dTDP-N-acetylfucosamine:lipid II N-acetylfucosaminyltransferase